MQTAIRRLPRTLVCATSLIALLSTAPAVEGHVNRTVGPYSLLVVLVEEPVYSDNHAGFQFWVRRNAVPIVGLESTVHAAASGHGVDVSLTVPPVDGTGFYVLDHTTDGAAFDPRGGGDWTLTLTGSIDGTPLDTTFPVTFPSYPRIGSTSDAAAPSAVAAPASGPSLVLVVGALLAAAVGVVLVFSRVRARSPGRPART